VQNWQPGAFSSVNEFLSRHETLGPSQELIERYLGQARQKLRALSESEGRAGLFEVTEYLARLTASLSE
jgi:geranylgeranyl pyrophosphate synthase